MDQLKEFLPFLVFAAIAIIKGISQANKDKAQKQPKNTVKPQQTSSQPQRQTWSAPAGQPTVNKPASSYEKVGPPPARKSPFEVLMEEFMEDKPQEGSVEPQYKRNYQEPRYDHPVVKVETNEVKPLKQKSTDLKNVEQLPEEVQKARAQHTRHEHEFERLGEYKLHADYHEEFDLRDAVIKSVILERYTS